jgi:peptidoglycan/LPS O-acetylase OafA/YrhL
MIKILLQKISLKINYEKRIYGLDIMRAMAILIVMLGHSGPLLNNTFLQDFPFLSLIDGVELFFVLSGFLIGGILLKEIEKPNFNLNALSNFWKRRWFRTLPNYYLILFVNILLVYYQIIPGKKDRITASFLIFTQNFKEPLVDFFWESWSLSIEEWFYLLFGITIFISIKFLKNMPAYLLCTVLLIVLPLLYRISISDKIVNDFWWDVTFRKTVLCRLDAIGYGVLAAFIQKKYYKIWTKSKNTLLVVGLCILLYWPYANVGYTSFFSKTFNFSILSIASAMLLPFFNNIKTGRGVALKIFTYTSILSYSLYLINLSIVEQIIAGYIKFNGVFNYVLFWIACYFLAYILYRFYEKPMMLLRDKV